MFGRATIRLGIGPHSSLIWVTPGLQSDLLRVFHAEVLKNIKQPEALPVFFEGRPSARIRICNILLMAQA